MKGTNSQSSARMAAVVVGLGAIGVSLIPVSAAMADVTSVTDTITVNVAETCTFKNTTNETFVGTALNGAEATFSNNNRVHTFYLFCNNNGGYTVSAQAYDLEAENTDDIIAYTDSYAPSGTDGKWTAEIDSSEPGVTKISPVPAGDGGVIIRSDTSSSASMSFTATYSAYVGTTTAAGTYTGRIEYVLSSLDGTGNSGNSGSDTGNTGNTEQNNDDNNGGGGTEPGGEATDKTDDEPGGQSSGDNTSGTNTSNPDNTSNTPSNTPSVTPQVQSNTYNTYNTYNSYSTTNYPSTNSSTPAIAGTQSTTSGSGSNSLATSNNSKSTGASDNYEKPLGVTTTTTTSNKESGVDPMPIVVIGTALGVAGVAAIAVAAQKRKNED